MIDKWNKKYLLILYFVLFFWKNVKNRVFLLWKNVKIEVVLYWKNVELCLKGKFQSI